MGGCGRPRPRRRRAWIGEGLETREDNCEFTSAAAGGCWLQTTEVKLDGEHRSLGPAAEQLDLGSKSCAKWATKRPHCNLRSLKGGK